MRCVGLEESHISDRMPKRSGVLRLTLSLPRDLPMSENMAPYSLSLSKCRLRVRIPVAFLLLGLPTLTKSRFLGLRRVTGKGENPVKSRQRMIKRDTVLIQHHHGVDSGD